MALVNNFWQLFLVSAPWLLLGLFLAGLLKVFIPSDFLQRHLGKEGFWTTVKAALIGAPMPLCSCGVIPAAVGLRRAGGSKSATTAFLVSTPETGVDSISVSYVLLGPFMAVIRPIAAVISAITAGFLVGKDPALSDSKATIKSNVGGCCGTKTAQKEPKAKECSSETSKLAPSSCCARKVDSETNQVINRGEEAKACCDSANNAPSLSQKIGQALHFSCNKLLSDTVVWLLIGLFFAALVQTFIPTSYLAEWGTGIGAMVVMILISIPMYICATASTPIAAGLLLAGVSPGAVLVFMLAGPATNIATIGVVGKELGRRAVYAYLTGVIGVAIIFGYLTDFLVIRYGFEVAPMIQEGHNMLPEWLSIGFGILLLGLIFRLWGMFVYDKFYKKMVGGQT